jgi:Zn-finger domain-containing protein
MVYKDKDEAAVRWELKPRFYSKTEDRILTIIKQARCVINNPERKLAYKVGYLEESLKSIEESIKEEVEVYTSYE